MFKGDSTFRISFLKPGPGLDLKDMLPEEFNVHLAIWLEPFVAWGQGAERYKVQELSIPPYVALDWMDIEKNPTKHWPLPVFRKDQQEHVSPVLPSDLRKDSKCWVQPQVPTHGKRQQPPRRNREILSKES